MKAIVYESNTGYTKSYAELLAKETGLPVYERSQAGNHLTNGDDIIYMGWMMAGDVKGYKKTSKLYNVLAVCGVGSGVMDGKQAHDIQERYHLKNTKVFYLQGGFDINKLHGLYKIMMKTMIKVIGKSMAKKDDKTDDEIKMLSMMQNGGSCVCVENLAPVLEWFNSKK